MEKVIEVKNLSKKYKNLIAVNNISFFVKKGEVFGLLGENGAGKTTTLEMIEGLRKPSSGKIEVLGLNTQKELVKIKQKIGVQLQSSAYYQYLKLNEIADLFNNFYYKKTNHDELFKLVNLETKKNEYINNLSGGQKQRFSIIASLINDPEIVFLDEPTTGLDPKARRNTWDIIAKIKEQGKTIILTTHYMEEAEILCDRIAIMDKGSIIALDKTHNLTAQANHPYKLEFILSANRSLNEEKKRNVVNTIKNKCSIKDKDIKRLPGKAAHYEIRFTTHADLNRAIGVLQKEDTESLSVGRAKLEDIFIELTGKKIAEQNENEEE